jgi:hypothetical protein
VSNDTAYFLAPDPPKAADPSAYEYVVVEAPRQSTGWRAYKNNYSGGPLPYCKKDANGTEPWSCWGRDSGTLPARP